MREPANRGGNHSHPQGVIDPVTNHPSDYSDSARCNALSSLPELSIPVVRAALPRQPVSYTFWSAGMVLSEDGVRKTLRLIGYLPCCAEHNDACFHFEDCLFRPSQVSFFIRLQPAPCDSVLSRFQCQLPTLTYGLDVIPQIQIQLPSAGLPPLRN